jgi:hypothetical protein
MEVTMWESCNFNNALQLSEWTNAVTTKLSGYKERNEDNLSEKKIVNPSSCRVFVM